eukprot:1194625-Prorocentrum_minimum.AAC.5
MDESKVEKMFQKLKKEGYEVHMIGLVISHAESCDRQINRAHETGRWPSKGLAYGMLDVRRLQTNKQTNKQANMQEAAAWTYGYNHKGATT